MITAHFDYHVATSLDDAIHFLADNPESKVLAGGQQLTKELKLGRLQLSTLVDLGQITNLKVLDKQDGKVTMGAMLSFRDTLQSTLIKDYQGLSQALTALLDKHARNAVTLGGCLATGDPESHLAAILLALQADINIIGPRGQRSVPADLFFQGVGKTALESNEIITSLSFVEAQGRSAYETIGHPVSSHALCGVAVVMPHHDTFRDCRIAVTGATEKAMRLSTVEAALAQSSFDDAGISYASSQIPQDLAWFSSRFASGEYRAHLTKALTRRVLTKLRAQV